MKYQVGDSIIVNLTNEAGKIIEILNESMVLIDVKGVKFPAYMDQIDFPYFNMFSKAMKAEPVKPKLYIDDVKKEKKQIITTKALTTKQPNGVWLQLIPILSEDEFGDDIIEFFKIYIVNETEHLLEFKYDLLLAGNSNFDIANEVLPYHDFYIHDIAIENFSDNPKFNVTFNLKNKDKTKVEFLETTYKLKGKQVFQQLELMKQTGSASIRHLLFKAYPEKVYTEKLNLDKLTNSGIKVTDAKQYIANLPTPRTVIDLHIEKLVHDSTHMTNGEIMQIQLQELEKWYSIAVLQNAPFLIVVHGVGDGILRNEVHEYIKYKKEVKRFVNQYHPSFGWGATEIFFE